MQTTLLKYKIQSSRYKIQSDIQEYDPNDKNPHIDDIINDCIYHFLFDEYKDNDNPPPLVFDSKQNCIKIMNSRKCVLRFKIDQDYLNQITKIIISDTDLLKTYLNYSMKFVATEKSINQESINELLAKYERGILKTPHDIILGQKLVCDDFLSRLDADELRKFIKREGDFYLHNQNLFSIHMTNFYQYDDQFGAAHVRYDHRMSDKYKLQNIEKIFECLHDEISSHSKGRFRNRITINQIDGQLWAPFQVRYKTGGKNSYMPKFMEDDDKEIIANFCVPMNSDQNGKISIESSNTKKLISELDSFIDKFLKNPAKDPLVIPQIFI